MMAMLSRPLFPKAIMPMVSDPSPLLLVPMLILSAGAVALGYLANELFLSYGSSFYLNSIFTHPSHFLILNAPFAGSSLAIIPLCFLFLIFTILIISYSSADYSTEAGGGSSTKFYLNQRSYLESSSIGITSTSTSTSPFRGGVKAGIVASEDTVAKNSRDGGQLYHADGGPSFADSIPKVEVIRFAKGLSDSSCGKEPFFTYTASALNHFNVFYHWVMHNVLLFSVYLYRYIDKGILEILGPLGLVRLLQYMGFYIELISTGYIPHYSLILIGFLTITILPTMYLGAFL